jgi:hypothetical protein
MYPVAGVLLALTANAAPPKKIRNPDNPASNFFRELDMMFSIGQPVFLSMEG